MNLLTLYPIQSCNLNCYYCPMKKWTYPVDHPANKLTNDIMFQWIDRYLDPSEWLIEVSGGEPGMYPEIDGFIRGLSERGFYGLIKTNGTLPIPKTNTFRRIAAWHESCDINHPPKYVDTMLIIRNPNDNWEEKLAYCKSHGIPYRDLQFIPFHLGDDAKNNMAGDPPRANKFIDNWCCIYSGGRIAKCHNSESSEEISMQNMTPPLTRAIRRGCKYCDQVGGFDIFIPSEWEEMIMENTDKMKSNKTIIYKK